MKKSIDSETLADQAFDIASKYLQPGVSTELNISGPLRDSINSIVLGEQSTTKQNLFNAFDIAQNEAIKMMAMGAFPRFLSSDAFIRYRALDHISDTIVRQKMSNELDRLLDSTSWLSYLLASVEHLPICVSLAAASKQTAGFPLIYVNACFEKTTGYPRDEIIGQNCRFLQMGKVAGHVSEGESISRMSAALRDGKESKVVITNFRKDGTPFRNLLAMKPILDQNGEYAFVLGVQFDIGDKDANPDKMRIVDDLFRVLPSVIICNAVTDAHVLDVIKVI